jgi:hypothetical protein
MAYSINKTTGEVLITLIDGTADGPDINPGSNASDLDLFGKNYPFYGELLDENFIKLLQNFANVTAPATPLQGELWYDISTAGNHILRIYDGASWLPVTPVWVSSSAPLTTQVGAQWWDSNKYQLNMYNGTGWTLVGPGYSRLDGKSGAIAEDVTDTSNVTHKVIKFYTNNNVSAIVSYDQPFTLSATSAVTGFSVISPGITLAAEANNLFYGTATNSQQLGNIAAVNYARNDIDSVFSGNISTNSSKINIASIPSTGTGRFTNTVFNANISFHVNQYGVDTRAVSINGATGEITVNQNPTTALGLTPKQYVDSSIITAISPLATINSPTLTGIPLAPNSAPTSNTAQIATMASVQGAILNSNTALWLGSNKTISTNLPVNGVGNPGDFWFQI